MRRQAKYASLRRHFKDSRTSANEQTVLNHEYPTAKSTSVSAAENFYRPGEDNRPASGGRFSTGSSSRRTTTPPSQRGLAGLRTTPPTGLCSLCFDINISKLRTVGSKIRHCRNLRELIHSADTCVLCYIILKKVPVPPKESASQYDNSRRIEISTTNRSAELPEDAYGAGLDSIVAHLPVSRQADQRRTNISVQIPIIAGRESQAALTGDVIRRRTYGGTNALCIVNWLAECVQNHKDCRKSDGALADLLYVLPSRLLDLGCTDTSTIQLVDTDGSFIEPYVALTYTRGDASMSSTKSTNLTARRKAIPMEKFNKTFRQAIQMCRVLGFRYLWIDAFCILMDSMEDRDKHVPRMGLIFHNAALTLSASVSLSADEGLIRFKPKTVAEAKIPYRTEDGIPLGQFSVLDYKAKGFQEEIIPGTLNRRAWCMQARLMSRRTIHFGHDQVYFECDTNIWSEDCIFPIPTRSITDPLAIWRREFLACKRSLIPPPSQSKTVKTVRFANPIKGTSPWLHILWYSLVAQYTARTLPRESDKTSAIAGLAYVFACLLSHQLRSSNTGKTPRKTPADRYVSGLWQNDLPLGLLWSPGSFRQWQPQHIPSSSKVLAPSWSWLSANGPLHWPEGVIFSGDSFTGRSFMRVVEIGSFRDENEDHEYATLRVRGKVALLNRLYGFRAEDQAFKAAVREADISGSEASEGFEGPLRLPHALFDSAEVDRAWQQTYGAKTDHEQDDYYIRHPPRPSTTTRQTGLSSKSGPTKYRISITKKVTKTQHTSERKQEDFIALLVLPAGCGRQGCNEHDFGLATRPKGVVNNCGSGLAYALIVCPSKKARGMFQRVGIAQVRIADYATDERRRDREIVLV